MVFVNMALSTESEEDIAGGSDRWPRQCGHRFAAISA